MGRGGQGESVGLRSALTARVVFHPGEAVLWTMLSEEHAVAGRVGRARVCAAMAGRLEATMPQPVVARA